MDKQTFLKQLRNELQRNFTRRETAETLTDYEGFFEVSEMEKSEGEICEELGPPHSIARNLAEELGRRGPPIPRTLLQMALTAALFIACYFLYFSFAGFTGYAVRDGLLIFAGLAVVLWIISGAFRRQSPPNPKKTQWWVLLSGHAALLCMAVICYAQIQGMLIRSLGYFPGDVFEWDYRVVFLTELFMVVSVVIAVFSVYGCSRLSGQYYSMLLHAAGTISYLYAVYGFLRAVDLPELSIENILTNPLEMVTNLLETMLNLFLIVCGAAALLTVLSVIVIQHCERRRRDGSPT